ncbi:MAG TPA: type II secretion system protein GspM [Gammaproteobacteria bacterium]|nr:type II secretion system protein GspM [Gammaproteobacteria bacterium]
MMQAKWLKIKEGWFDLTMRERRIIIVGGLLTTILMGYQLFWLPLLNHIASMRELVKTNQTILIWMRSADQAIQTINKQVGHQSKINSPIIFLDRLQKQIDQFGFNRVLTQLKQSGDETIEIHFQKIEFDQLMRFLLSGTRQQPISISKMRVVAIDTPGLVNAEMVLEVTQ